MKTPTPPDRLYLYRLFCVGCTLKVLSEHKNIGDLWEDILSREKQGHDRIDFWEPRVDHCEEIVVRPSKIVAVDRLAETDLTPEQPNRKERRREDQERREHESSTSLGKGGIQIGQTVKKG